MTALARLLTDRGITTAVVIDDAYDDFPRATDLRAAEWDVFFDDVGVNPNALRIVTEAYPAFTDADPEDLRNSDEFVAALWRARATLSPTAQAQVFSVYEPQNAAERQKLDTLVAALRAMGLTCTPMGRDFAMEDARRADVIFIDLFLGFPQAADDMSRAIERAKGLVRDREAAPPLVILMSRSPRLMEKRNDFRDSAGLLSSAFRVVSKADLEQPGVLDRLLYRLTNHYEDAKRVAQFVHAWDSSFEEARKRFIKIIRRLDLSDFAQVRSLLLAFEGQPLGEYLLDVCDGVLRHEIEANAGTIAAAHALNEIDLENYPAPHLTGTTDLQELVRRMVFQHSERLVLSQAGTEVRLQFGDILHWKNTQSGEFGNDVSLVVTPSCDMIRDEADHILLLAGTLLPLEPTKWLYQPNQARTPILEIPEVGRFWIKWDLKKVQARTREELNPLLGERAELKRIARLREMYAIEIQQKFLADFGRVGQPANPPATFAVSLSVLYVDAGGNARPLETGELDGAACYVGRDKDSRPIHHLVVSEQTCDTIEKAVAALELNSVHASARASLTALKADKEFFVQLERGKTEVPSDDKAGPKQIKGADANIYAYVRRNSDWSNGKQITENNHRKASLLINVADISDEETAVEPPEGGAAPAAA